MPQLVFLNKADLPGAAEESEVMAALGLEDNEVCMVRGSAAFESGRLMATVRAWLVDASFLSMRY